MKRGRSCGIGGVIAVFLSAAEHGGLHPLQRTAAKAEQGFDSVTYVAQLLEKGEAGVPLLPLQQGRVRAMRMWSAWLEP